MKQEYTNWGDTLHKVIVMKGNLVEIIKEIIIRGSFANKHAFRMN